MYIIVDSQDKMFLTKDDIWGDNGWYWSMIKIDEMPETGPYVFSDLIECQKVFEERKTSSSAIFKVVLEEITGVKGFD